jgi:hypothetical protein
MHTIILAFVIALAGFVVIAGGAWELSTLEAAEGEVRLRPLRNAAARRGSSDPPPTNPTTGIVGCCCSAIDARLRS